MRWCRDPRSVIFFRFIGLNKKKSTKRIFNFYSNLACSLEYKDNAYDDIELPVSATFFRYDCVVFCKGEIIRIYQIISRKLSRLISLKIRFKRWLTWFEQTLIDMVLFMKNIHIAYPPAATAATSTNIRRVVRTVLSMIEQWLWTEWRCLYKERLKRFGHTFSLSSYMSRLLILHRSWFLVRECSCHVLSISPFTFGQGWIFPANVKKNYIFVLFIFISRKKLRVMNSDEIHRSIFVYCFVYT